MRHRSQRPAWIAVFLVAGWAGGNSFAQTLETETARLVPVGWWKVGTALEYQTSSEGTEAAVPMLAEYGFTDNLELVLEPVAYTAIRPKSDTSAVGPGDFEVTLTWRFAREGARLPAMAVAGEVKLPTARDTLIGTGETDYAGYFIASKRFHKFDVHLNLSYTVPGNPPGAQLDHLFGYALATVYRPSDRSEWFAEVLGNTSTGSHGETADSAPASGTTVVPEASGGERVGTIGFGRSIRPNLLLFLGVSYDNTNALLIRPGLTYKFPTGRSTGRAATK